MNLRSRWSIKACRLVAGLALTIVASSAWAGAWTRDQYHVFAQIGLGFTFNTQNVDCGSVNGVPQTCGTTFDGNGNKVPLKVRQNKETKTLGGGNFQQLLTDLYIEFGLFKRFTVFTDIPLVSMRQKNPGGNINYANGANIGDILVGLRGGVLVDPIALAIELRMVAPSGDVNDVIPTGSGAFSGELRIAMGKAFQRLPIWVDFEMGAMLRGTADVYIDRYAAMPVTAPLQYAPQLLIHAEVGGTLVRWQGVDRLQLVLNADYMMAITRDAPADAAFTIQPRTPELATIGATLAWYVYHGVGVSARFTQALSGRYLPFYTNIGGAVFVNY